MEKSEYVPYNRIRKESINSREYHDNLVNLITLGRWRLEDEADIKLEEGRTYTPSATKEVSRAMENLAALKGFDAKYEKILPKFKSCLMGALLN